MATIKRLSNSWQLVASYSATKKHCPIGAAGLARATGFGTASPTFSPAGDNAGFLTPNTEINTSDDTWEWDAKVSGTYVLPADFVVSASFHHTSGDPFARQVRFTGGRTVPFVILNVDPIGTYRRPHLNIMTARVEKRFTVASCADCDDLAEYLQRAEREHGDRSCRTARAPTSCSPCRSCRPASWR